MCTVSIFTPGTWGPTSEKGSPEEEHLDTSCPEFTLNVKKVKGQRVPARPLHFRDVLVRFAGVSAGSWPLFVADFVALRSDDTP